MLGMALETSRSSDLRETHLVKCFVCIVLGVQNKQITMEIENMYDQFEMELLVRLRRERKKMRKGEVLVRKKKAKMGATG